MPTYFLYSIQNVSLSSNNIDINLDTIISERVKLRSCILIFLFFFLLLFEDHNFSSKSTSTKLFFFSFLLPSIIFLLLEISFVTSLRKNHTPTPTTRERILIYEWEEEERKRKGRNDTCFSMCQWSFCMLGMLKFFKWREFTRWVRKKTTSSEMESKLYLSNIQMLRVA